MLEFLKVWISKTEGKFKSIPNNYMGLILILILITLWIK